MKKDEGVGRPAPWAVKVLRRVVRPVVRVAFRPELQGEQNLPPGRPFLLVANHSAGIGLAEIACFASLYVERVGADRPLAGFAHPIAFRVAPMRYLLRGLGAVPSTYGAAADALERGVPLLVFPGGDHETLRPVWQAGRVDFGGRQGFLRVARGAGVPIVPMAITGSHFTAPILLRSKALASVLVLPRLMGLKRWGLSVLGVLGAVPILTAPVALPLRGALLWAWLTSPLVFLPFVPWRIRFRIGEPMEPEALFEPGAAEPADLARALARVQAEVQSLHDGG